MSAFEYPDLHKFPPFYTLQPNADTRNKQLRGWTELILSYFRHHNLYQFDLQEMTAWELFNNQKIQRKLKIEDMRTIFDHLAGKGNVEWSDASKTRGLLLWRSPVEWAAVIYDWLTENAKQNTIMTVYELLHADITEGTEIHGMDEAVLIKALKELEQQGKAQVFSGNSTEEYGVKFF